MTTSGIEIVPEDYGDASKVQAGFVAVTVWSPVYRGKTGKTKELTESLIPLVLMVNRWDGRLGFPGGKLDPGEAFPVAAVRELMEETGVRILPNAIHHLLGYSSETVVGHLYHYHAGIRPVSFLTKVLAESSRAAGTISEGNAFWAHLANYPNGKGWETLRRSANFAPAVGVELDALRAAIYATAPTEAHP